MSTLPLVIEPEQLEPLLHSDNILLVDLCKRETYLQQHLPGAVHLDYAQIVRSEPPVGGLVPLAPAFEQVIQALGINKNTHVIAYDEEGGGNASRLVWTLHAYGHQLASILNGGIFSWANEGHPMQMDIPQRDASDYSLSLLGTSIIERDEILQRLQDDDFALLDARSLDEFTGAVKYSARGGRIPGAQRLEWTDMMDLNRNLRLKPEAELRAMLEQRGFSADKDIAVYCQTHHRSALSYLALLHLGYARVRGYHGAWSDWGNQTETPLETG